MQIDMEEKFKEVLKKYEAPFIEMLHDMCITHMAIGFSDESPMWLQYRGIDYSDEQRRIMFKNSQVDLGFYLNWIDEDDKGWFIGADEAYEFFKEIKYRYIKETFPTIYKESPLTMLR